MIHYVCSVQAHPGCAEIIPSRGASAYWDDGEQEWLMSDDMEPDIDPCHVCSGAVVEETEEEKV